VSQGDDEINALYRGAETAKLVGAAWDLPARVYSPNALTDLRNWAILKYLTVACTCYFGVKIFGSPVELGLTS
jgi:hypothetical protein